MPRAITYCTKDDLLLGDIPLHPRWGDGTPGVDMAADEIDSKLGHLYVTPFQIDGTEARNKPAVLLLKLINQLLASGRIILDQAAVGEDDTLHAYGQRMVDEAHGSLELIRTGQIDLEGATELPPVEGGELPANNSVSINNEDPYSLVQAYYDRMPGTGPYGSPRSPSIRPYDQRTFVP